MVLFLFYVNHINSLRPQSSFDFCIRKFLIVSFAFICLQPVWSQNTCADSSPPSDRFTIAVHEFPPYYDKTGRGMLSDIIHSAFASQDVEVAFVTLPPKRGIAEFIQGRVDAHSPGRAFMSKDMADKFTSVDTFKYISGVFKLHREVRGRLSKPEYNFNGLPSLKEDLNSAQSIRLLTERGLGNSKILALTSYARDAEKLGRADINLIQAQSAEQMVKMVLKRDINYFGSTLISGLLLTKGVAAQRARDFEFIPLTVTTGSLTFRKKSGRSQYLASRAAKGIKHIIDSGEYLQILESYWGEGNVPQVVLPKAIMHLGTKNFNRELFWNQRRDIAYRIIKEE